MTKFKQREKPCPTCPYLKSTPPGVWHPDEYKKLEKYDYDPWEGKSPELSIFHCHYTTRGIDKNTICQGWLDCHGADELISMRIARLSGKIPDDFRWEPSGADVYKSGKEAAIKGLMGVKNPSEKAKKLINKLEIK
jgi:hypothetical protein